MLPCICINLENVQPNGPSTNKKKTNRVNMDPHVSKQNVRYSIPYDRDPIIKQTPTNSNRSKGIKRMRMAINKVSNFSDLIHRVTGSCLLRRLSTPSDDSETDDVEEEREREFLVWEGVREDKLIEMEMLIGEVFDAVSVIKRAYISLQEAHCPWDPDRMRLFDVAVVAELRRIGLLRDRFRLQSTNDNAGGTLSMREAVAPALYKAAMEELKRALKVKNVEVEMLKEKLKTAASINGKKGISPHHSRRRVCCSTQAYGLGAPATELFEATISMVKAASKSFTKLLLSLMKSAHWDIAAAVRSIEAAVGAMDSVVGPNEAKYAMESYVNHKIFQDFDHETFNMVMDGIGSGNLSSLLHPDQFRRHYFNQYSDMKAMDPTELLGILPTCDFGKFCSKKYLSIVHPKMEESLFGDLEQRYQVLAGNHPRSLFYREFLGLAKAIWLLHLLAFSLEPPPSYFEGTRGAEFHPQYMESVVRFSGGRAVVGFLVSPGFNLANGSVIKTRVYLLPKNGY